ncbi:glycosyltransferase family 4 protein [Paradesertivirga mongoliensis]|uniref:Glycosyltransferase family 4 protein n=1 Tax=Paradesertivirga mongoliensis TaxID=2100740 RepID=A0ABW4ZG84_9SPHI|nr:glycosyltransferase family 4 protein [Pedobacter mongoliensis]
MKNLAIVITHPIQYYSPLLKLLGCKPNLNLKVFYTWGNKAITKHDPGFNKTIQWDIPLLDGYDYEFLDNTATQPGSHHFSGISNPGAIKRITQFSPHAILVFGWAYHSHLQIIRHFRGKVPIWFRGDSTLLCESFGLKRLLKYIFLRWVYSHVDRAFYVGTNNKEYFKKYGLREEQLIFAPHAVDNDRFRVDYSKEAEIKREQLGIKKSDIVILFAGKFEAVKNPFLLLEAFVELESDDVHLLFVGNGNLERELKISSAKHKAKNRIHFLDFQNQRSMPIIYQCCDIYCLPSDSETWGLAINEAMAGGKAIVASDKVGSASDLIINDVNGCIFEAGNKSNLLFTLKRLTNKKKLEEMGNKSKEVIKKWNLQDVANTIWMEMMK